MARHSLASLSLISSVLLLCFLRANGYPGGVPESQCLSMAPSHNGLTPQEGPSPFFITVDRNSVQSGQPVRVTLASATNQNHFIGFFAMGQKVIGANQASGTPSGQVVLPQNQHVRHVNCDANLPNGTISHNYPVQRAQQQFDWIAPWNDKGEFVILASFVQDFKTFWVRLASEKIQVF